VSGTQTQPKFWSGNEIRETFLRFFEGKGHRRVRSSSLVPHGDPTLLFTNAGMNQFKDVFLGLEKRDYDKATSAQKCVRAGGKHNDLENVGFTKRHHTFFEMLGNFSFGDYFKEKAIPYAWELLTSPEWFAIPKEKLYVTVFEQSEVSPGQVVSGDHESLTHWSKTATGLPADRIRLLGAETNFWAMGDTGPCGPCSEIHYDMGQWAVDNPQSPKCAAGECAFPCDCGRYVEIWNLVFMEFNRDASGKLTRLPKPCVDTGMGLERVAAVLQGVISNYDTDLFRPLMSEAAVLLHHDMTDADEETSRRIIADHSRAATFLISDGVIPSNDGRGSVLRKIINRALLNMGPPESLSEHLFPAMADAVVREMGAAYPEIVENVPHVRKVLASETMRFRRTMTTSLRKLEEEVAIVQKKAQETLPRTSMLIGTPTLSGEVAFRLYDTFGLKRDVIEEATRLRGVTVDWPGFEQAMEQQQQRGRASWKGGATKEAANPAFAKIAAQFTTEPCFYFATSAKDARVEAIITKNGSVKELKAGESGEVVLDRTVIYAESGGQVADTGAFYDPSGSQVVAEVSGAYYPVARLVAHRVTAKETLRVCDRVSVEADAERRARIMRNHSGTHLVHAALRNILGTHVKQAGSLNAPDRLRFDFSHFSHVDAEELRDIEQQVNDEIRYNCQIETAVTSLEEALASGALAFFGDKYPESNVRVVTMPDARSPRGFYSKELCGGTHVHRVGDIGVLKIVSEQSVAAGVRRIEAVTGVGALEHYQQRAQLLSQIASKLNVGEDAVLATVEKLSETAKHLEKELETQKRKGALGQLDDLTAQVQMVKGVKVIAAEVANIDREGLRQLVDSLRQKLGSGVVALGMPDDGKVALIAGVTKDLTSKVHAGKLIQALAKQVGGSGGGRPDLAEAGGKDTSALKSALQSIPSLLEPLL
jgi:alanyl-tRNA synthetase